MTSPAHYSQYVLRETLCQLETYSFHLLKWNRAINLIAKTTEKELWGRHIEDALQLLAYLPKANAQIADMGSGAGLPGLVLAIACPRLHFTLIEQDQRKAAFLQEMLRVLSLDNVSLEVTAIEKITGCFDVILARALAPLSILIQFAYPLLGAKTICLFPKGENFATELDEAREHWSFQHKIIPSRTHERACIISITELETKNNGST